MASKKLNSMRILEANDIPYQVVTFDASIHSAEGVAQVADVPLAHVYKTLVALPNEPGRPAPVLVLLAADRQLDLKALAQVAGHKKMRMAGHSEAEKLTGLQVGGISPLALLVKNWPVYIDAAVEELDWILLSAGQRGVDLRVAVADLKRLLEPISAAVSTPVA